MRRLLVVLFLMAVPAPAQAGTLAFSSTRSDPCPGAPCSRTIWTVDEKGGGLREITRIGAGFRLRVDQWPSWAPDGRSVVYSRIAAWPDDGSYRAAPDQNGLFVASADGSSQRPLVTGGSEGRPDWSPDGRLIAFESFRRGGAGLPKGPPGGLPESDVMVVGADGSNMRRLTNGPSPESGPWFSPDGRRILFFRFGAAGGAAPGTGADTGFYSISPQGGPEERLTVGGDHPRPTFSQDGRWVALSAPAGLWVMRADGSGARLVSRAAVGFPEDQTVAWSPNGPTLFFSAFLNGSDLKGGVSIYRLDLSRPGQRPVRITSFAGAPVADLYVDWHGPVPVRRDSSPPAAHLVRDEGLIARTVDRDNAAFLAVDPSGVKSIAVSVVKRAPRARTASRRCRFLTGRRLGRRRSCGKPVFQRVGSSSALRRRIGRLRPGVYRVAFRTRDGAGNRTRRARFARVRITR